MLDRCLVTCDVSASGRVAQRAYAGFRVNPRRLLPCPRPAQSVTIAPYAMLAPDSNGDMMRILARLLAPLLFVPTLLGAQATPATPSAAPSAADPRLERLKADVIRGIDARAKLGQQ